MGIGPVGRPPGEDEARSWRARSGRPVGGPKKERGRMESVTDSRALQAGKAGGIVRQVRSRPGLMRRPASGEPAPHRVQVEHLHGFVPHGERVDAVAGEFGHHAVRQVE